MNKDAKYLTKSSIKEIRSHCKHSKMLIRNFTPTKLRFIRESFSNIEKEIARIEHYTEVTDGISKEK